MLTRRDFMKKSAVALGLAAAVPVVAVAVKPEGRPYIDITYTPAPQFGSIIYECERCHHSIQIPCANIYDASLYKKSRWFVEHELGWLLKQNPHHCICPGCLGWHLNIAIDCKGGRLTPNLNAQPHSVMRICPEHVE